MVLNQFLNSVGPLWTFLKPFYKPSQPDKCADCTRKWFAHLNQPLYAAAQLTAQCAPLFHFCLFCICQLQCRQWLAHMRGGGWWEVDAFQYPSITRTWKSSWTAGSLNMVRPQLMVGPFDLIAAQFEEIMHGWFWFSFDLILSWSQRWADHICAHGNCPRRDIWESEWGRAGQGRREWGI